MELTAEEEGTLQGRKGKAKMKAMELLLKVGKVYDAKRLINISRVHVLTSLINYHDVGIQVVEEFSTTGGKYEVSTTIDPVSMSLEGTDFNLPAELIKKQQRIMKAHEDMGVLPTWTCTPYLYENVPGFGENIAWAESSAVIFANSVLGARTNRMSTGLDIAAALVGKIPEFGLHLTSNRKPSVLVNIKVEDLKNLDFHTIGLLLGKLTRGKIPFIKGLPCNTSFDQLKNLGSGLAMTGGLALFHADGITAEVKYNFITVNDQDFPEKFDVLRSDLKRMEEELTTNREKVDLIALGCPLYSIDEVRFVVEELSRNSASVKIPVWLYTSPYVKWICGNLGYLKTLKRAGVEVLSGTCPVISFLKYSGKRSIMLDSARAAHLIPSEHGVDVIYASTKECLDTAIRGG